MQNGEKHRAFKREAMLTRTGEVLDDLPAPGLLPQSFEDGSGPDASRRARRHGAIGDGVDDNGFRGEARARRRNRSNCPLSRNSWTRPSVATIIGNYTLKATNDANVRLHLRENRQAIQTISMAYRARPNL
jgi:hypothetical protein